MSNYEDYMVREQGQVAKAVAAVTAEVKRLEKADNNAFAKYKFTSVDDYKDFLRPLMSKNGLSVGMSQTRFDRFQHTTDGKKETTHCQYDFELWLEHESGEKGDREGTTVCLPYTGAQTTGQARSYAQKEWLKSKFLASSGDTAEDADSHSFDVTLPKAAARDLHEKMVEELRRYAKECPDEKHLKEWYDKNHVLIEAMPDDWTVYLRNEYHQALLAIKARDKGVKVRAKKKEELPEEVGLEQLLAEATLATIKDVERHINDNAAVWGAVKTEEAWELYEARIIELNPPA